MIDRRSLLASLGALLCSTALPPLPAQSGASTIQFGNATSPRVLVVGCGPGVTGVTVNGVSATKHAEEGGVSIWYSKIMDGARHTDVHVSNGDLIHMWDVRGADIYA